jgi:hypothetical protein
VIDYDGRRFRLAGDDAAAVAVYHQDGDVVWAEVAGGTVRRGSLAGVNSDGTLHLGYTIVLASGEVVCGHTVNTPEVGADGRVRLREAWQRFRPVAASGVSYLDELR